MGHLASLSHDPSDFQGAFTSIGTLASHTGGENEMHSAKDLAGYTVVSGKIGLASSARSWLWDTASLPPSGPPKAWRRAILLSPGWAPGLPDSADPQAIPHNGDLCLSGSIFGSIWNLPKTPSEGRVAAESPSQWRAVKETASAPRAVGGGYGFEVVPVYIHTQSRKVGLGVLNTRPVVPQPPYPTRWTRYTRLARQRDTFCPCNSCFRVIKIGTSSFLSQNIPFTTRR